MLSPCSHKRSTSRISNTRTSRNAIAASWTRWSDSGNCTDNGTSLTFSVIGEGSVIEIGGQLIAKGDGVICVLVSAPKRGAIDLGAIDRF